MGLGLFIGVRPKVSVGVQTGGQHLFSHRSVEESRIVVVPVRPHGGTPAPRPRDPSPRVAAAAGGVGGGGRAAVESSPRLPEASRAPPLPESSLWTRSPRKSPGGVVVRGGTHMASLAPVRPMR